MTTDANGDAAFTATLPIAANPGDWVTGTATDPADNTSEFSTCVQAAAAVARYNWRYEYDPLYRLTYACSNWDEVAASCKPGAEFFRYTYDAVGNRLTQETLAGTNIYSYDIGNRLTSVDGVAYTWDAKGNLLSDGASTYTYNHANRLTAVSGQPSAYSFTYNGLGDRLRQTVNGSPINYPLDLEGGLTQVLADGTNTYLYGVARIGEEQPGGWQYHLGDALGSVRQLANGGAAVTLARSYEQFGDTITSVGTAATVFQFTGEQRDATGLTYLRARYYASYLNQWIQPDPIVPDPYIPADWNHYTYVRNNPINYTDPSGHDPWWCEERQDKALCEARYLLGQGGGLTDDTLEAIYDYSRLDAVIAVQREFAIRLPAGYSFRFALSTSPAILENGRGVFGIQLWFWEINWRAQQGQIISEISSLSCAIRIPSDTGVAREMDFSVYITELAFKSFGFDPDDVGATMIHEATHAWQESIARDHVLLLGAPGDPSSLNWFNKHRGGMERQASQKALDADSAGRIDMSPGMWVLQQLTKVLNPGTQFPWPIPAGVP